MAVLLTTGIVENLQVAGGNRGERMDRGPFGRQGASGRLGRESRRGDTVGGRRGTATAPAGNAAPC